MAARPYIGRVGRDWASILLGGLALILLACGVLSWNSVREGIQEHAQERLNLEADRMADAVQSAVNLYAQPLYSLDGFLEVVPNARRADFDAFIGGMDLKKNPAQVFSLGYVERVSPQRVSSFALRMRADGYKDFSPAKDVSNDDRYLTRHIYMREGEKLPANMAFNYAKEGTRFAAIMAARDTGELAMSEPLTLRTGTGDRRGFVMFLPVYTPRAPRGSLDERRVSFRGVVGVGFKADQFFPNALREVGIPSTMRLYVHDPNESKLGAGELYLHDAAVDVKRRLSAVREVRVADRTWKLEFAVPQDYGMSFFERAAPRVFLIRNILFALTLPAVLYLLIFLCHSKREAAKNAERS